jgi:hypothetical protein
MRSGEEFEATELPWYLTLHWIWLAIAEFVEFAIRTRYGWTRWPFLDVILLWSILQAGWLSRVDQRSTTIYWYAGDMVLLVASTSGIIQNKLPALAGLLGSAVAVLAIIGIFHFRRDMKRYFSDTDNIDWDLNPWMIFLFNTLYFQCLFGEISKLRISDSLRITPDAE